MLPGKTYRPEDALKILRKRYWLVLVPWAVVAAVTAGVARKLPDLYESHAVIQVVPPKVQSSLLRQDPSPIAFESRLQAIDQTIRTRAKLERLIGDFNLYEEERKTEIMQDVIERMQSDITVKSQKGETFLVGYVGRNPSQVQKVTDRLATMFIDESYRQGTQRAEGTNSYVESQVDDALRRLEVTEQALTDYRIKHAGELPEQEMSNIQSMQNLQMQLQQVTAQLAAHQSNKLQLERIIAEVENLTEPPSSAPTTDAILPIAQQLKNAENALALLLVSKKPDNPDVQAMQRVVNGLRKQASAEAMRTEVGQPVPESPFEAGRKKRLAELHENLDQVMAQITARQADEKRLRVQVDGYQQRVNAAPVRSAELVKLLRDYDTVKQTYATLASQREGAKMTMNLESKQLGEQFNLIDPPRQPLKPYSPNRIVINIAGILGGLALGLALVGLTEYRDTSFKTDRELASVLSLPVLAVVPLMLSPAERRAEFRRKLIINLGLGSAVAVCGAVLAYTFLFVR